MKRIKDMLAFCGRLDRGFYPVMLLGDLIHFVQNGSCEVVDIFVLSDLVQGLHKLFLLQVLVGSLKHLLCKRWCSGTKWPCI